jgi:nitronate monooxygenase
VRKAELLDQLRLPLMATPMSIASTPDLVAACCRAGVLGCFPTHNAWKDAGLTHWLELIGSSRQRHADITVSGRPVRGQHQCVARETR